MTRKLTGHPHGGVGGDELRAVPGVAGVLGDPGFGAVLVAGHVFDGRPARGGLRSTARGQRPIAACVQSRMTGPAATLVTWDMPMVSLSFAR